MERLIGEVTHYFPRIGVAAISLDDDLNDGDEIEVRGAHSNFTQIVTSMQIEHRNIATASRGQEIGLRVDKSVQAGDKVFRMD